MMTMCDGDGDDDNYNDIRFNTQWFDDDNKNNNELKASSAQNYKAFIERAMIVNTNFDQS